MSDAEALLAAFITLPVVVGGVVGMATGAVILCGVAVCCAPCLCLTLVIVGPVLAFLAIAEYPNAARALMGLLAMCYGLWMGYVCWNEKIKDD